MIGIDPDVPDLIQEVLARALESAHRIREHAALKGWIGSVAIFTARTFLRDRRSRRQRIRLSAPDELPERPAPLALPEVTQTLARTYAALETLLEVDVEEPALCPIYGATVIDSVTIAPSPAWLRYRLHALGVMARGPCKLRTDY